MTDTTEVEKWIILHGELVREHDGPLVWSADYDALAIKLAEAERVARYETDIAQQALDQMKAEKARAEAAEAALVAAYRLGLGDAHRQAVMAGDQHAGLSASKVTDAICASIRALSTPTAAELMARIHTGEKDE